MNIFILTIVLFADIFSQYDLCLSRNISLYSELSQTGDIVCTIDLAHLEHKFINFDEDFDTRCSGNANEAKSMTICGVSSLSQFGIYSNDTGSTTGGNSYMLIYVLQRIKSCYNGIVNLELGYSDNYVTAIYYDNNDQYGLNGYVNSINISLNNMTPYPTFYPTGYPTPTPTVPTHAPTKSPTGNKDDIQFYNIQQYNPLNSNGNIANYFSRILASYTWWYQGKDSNGNRFWSTDINSIKLYYDTKNNKLTCGYIDGSTSESLQCVCSIDNNKDPIKCNNQWFVRNETISWIQLTSMNVYYHQAIKNCEYSKYINYTIPDTICIGDETIISSYGTPFEGRYNNTGCYDGFPQYIGTVYSDDQFIQYSYGRNEIGGDGYDSGVFGYCYGTDILSCDQNLKTIGNGYSFLDTRIRIRECE